MSAKDPLTTPLMRYHGGKYRLAPWVISHFGPHSTYTEPYGGAAGVLMRKPRSDFEVYNDLDEEIVNVFRVLRDPAVAEDLAQRCQLTPFARAEYDLAYEPTGNATERARRTLFRAAAGYGSAGATKGRSGFRSYAAGPGRAPHPADLWNQYPEAIAGFCQRLKGVIIEQRPALAVLQKYDTPDTLHYVDPPYLPETRRRHGGRYYRHEMTAADHEALLATLQQLEGSVVLSGYASDMYRDCLIHWAEYLRPTVASGQSGSASRIESLWLNAAAQDGLRQQDLFQQVPACAGCGA